MGRSTSLSIVNHAVRLFKRGHNCNIHQIIPFAILNINVINTADYSRAIDQVALIVAYYSNTISQIIEYQLSIGAVLTLHSYRACRVTAMTLPIAVPYLVIIYTSC